MEAENWVCVKEIFKDEWNLSDPTRVIAVRCLLAGFDSKEILDIIEDNDSDPRIQHLFREMLRKQKIAS